MLRYACAWSPLSSSSVSLSRRPLITPFSYVASLSLHLAHLSSNHSWLLCPLFFSFPRNLSRLAPSLSLVSSTSFFSSIVSLASSNDSLGPATVSMCWSENALVVVTVAIVVVRRCRSGDAGVVVGGRPVRREGKE